MAISAKTCNQVLERKELSYTVLNFINNVAREMVCQWHSLVSDVQQDAAI
jgi:ribosomal protein S24E